jgi:hypothetical protein
MYLPVFTTFAAIFISLSRMVSTNCLRIFAGNVNRLNQLKMLYARAWIRAQLALTVLERLLTISEKITKIYDFHKKKIPPCRI